MTRHFQHYPDQPGTKSCENSFLILYNAHNTASSFLDIFELTRKDRSVDDIPTDEEQDLLRAMLAFASSGLDSMVKQLIVDALPSAIDKSEGANEAFKRFIERRIRKNEEIDHRLLAEVISNVNPRDHLISLLIRELTSSNLQSVDALLRAGSFFDIPSPHICTYPNSLKDVFHVRNQIVHEMDVDFDQEDRNRRLRQKQSMVEYTEIIFETAENFLRAVDTKLSDY